MSKFSKIYNLSKKNDKQMCSKTVGMLEHRFDMNTVLKNHNKGVLVIMMYGTNKKQILKQPHRLFSFRPLLVC